MRLGIVAGSGLFFLALSQTATAGPASRLGAPASEPVTLYHTRKGDTLDGIAIHYLTGHRDMAVVVRMSGIRNPNRVPVGTVLRIPNRLLKSTPMTLTAVAVTGPVLRASGAGAAAPLAKGDILREGDRISTGANAFATLTKPDGTRVTLPSNTTLRVALLRRTALDDGARGDLVIESGRGEMVVTPLKGADRFEIRTPGSVAAVRGTEFRVIYDPGASVSTLEVLEGRVGESASDTGPSADIVTGQAAQRPRDGERRILPLPAAPSLAPPDPHGTFPDVVFKIADPHAGWSYRFVLARDPAFTDIFAEVTAADGVARFDFVPLAPVTAKITAIDENGVEGFPKTYLVERLPPTNPVTGG